MRIVTEAAAAAGRERSRASLRGNHRAPTPTPRHVPLLAHIQRGRLLKGGHLAIRQPQLHRDLHGGGAAQNGRWAGSGGRRRRRRCPSSAARVSAGSTRLITAPAFVVAHSGRPKSTWPLTAAAQHSAATAWPPLAITHGPCRLPRQSRRSATQSPAQLTQASSAMPEMIAGQSKPLSSAGQCRNGGCIDALAWAAYKPPHLRSALRPASQEAGHACAPLN